MQHKAISTGIEIGSTDHHKSIQFINEVMDVRIILQGWDNYRDASCAADTVEITCGYDRERRLIPLSAAVQRRGSVVQRVAEVSPQELLFDVRWKVYKETALFHYDNKDMYRAEEQAMKALDRQKTAGTVRCNGTR